MMWQSFHPAYARGHRDFDGFAFRRDAATRRIDLENDYIVAGHVGAEEPTAVRGDQEILWAFAAAGLDREECERAVFGDAVAGEGVVAAVSAV